MQEPLRALSQEFGEASEQIDQDSAWPERQLRSLQKSGFGGLLVPQEAGGMGLGLLGLAGACEILGQGCASTSMCFGMHAVGSAFIAAKATPEQRERFLKPIVEGRHLATLALSEPGTGSHFYFPQTQFTVADEGYRLSGTKSFITSGSHADSYVVSAVESEPSSPIGRFSCLVVDHGTPGLEWGKTWRGIGMRGNASRSLTLPGIVTPRGNLLGKEGDQIWYVFEVVAPYFLMAMAGTYLGIASAALTDAIAHLKSREYAHSGSRLADQPVLQHRLGDLWGKLAAARELTFRAARGGDAGEPGALPLILSAKAYVADIAVLVTNEVMTIMGGMSYAKGSRFDRHLRDARAAHMMAPTTDILKTWAGRAILGQPLLGD